MHIKNNNNKLKMNVIIYDFWAIIYKAMLVILHVKKTVFPRTAYRIFKKLSVN